MSKVTLPRLFYYYYYLFTYPYAHYFNHLLGIMISQPPVAVRIWHLPKW